MHARAGTHGYLRTTHIHLDRLSLHLLRLLLVAEHRMKNSRLICINHAAYFGFWFLFHQKFIGCIWPASLIVGHDANMRCMNILSRFCCNFVIRIDQCCIFNCRSFSGRRPACPSCDQWIPLARSMNIYKDSFSTCRKLKPKKHNLNVSIELMCTSSTSSSGSSAKLKSENQHRSNTCFTNW